MTGRRKSGRKSGSSSKKETPEKSRRSSRRRAHKKSESEPEDSGSDRSNDGPANALAAERDPLATTRREGGSNDASKEEESGGSDGAWQVRSENGNKGGIPKLKICLQRPAEMSSPTSDTLPSPRARKSRRGGNEDDTEENNDDTTSSDVNRAIGKDTSETPEGETERRPTRGRKHSEKKEEDTREREEVEEATRQLEEQETAARNLEELQRQETERKMIEAEKERELAEQKAEEEKRAAKLKAAEEAAIKKAEEDAKQKEAKEAKREQEARKKLLEEKEARRMSAEEKEARRKSLDEKEARRKSQEEKEARRKSQEEKEARRKSQEEKEARRKSQEEKESRRKEEEAENEAKKIKEQKAAQEKEDRRKVEEERKAQELAKTKEQVAVVSTKPEEEEVTEVPVKNEDRVMKDKVEQGGQGERQRRSPSRDSSEERAKEAALLSRKPKKQEGSEEGEVLESPEREPSFPSRSGNRIRTTGTTAAAVVEETKENHHEAAPVVRKRRWGSSNSRALKKPAVVISTAVLKEIIPEAKPVALSEVHLSPNEDEDMEEGEARDGSRRGSKSDEGRGSRRNSRSENEQDEGRATEKSPVKRRRRSVPSDESEKDYEEEGVESGGEEMVKKEAPAVKNHVEEDAKPAKIEMPQPVRKVLPPDPLVAMNKQRSPSPARHPPSTVLYITNLVRPFTVVQLRDLLARTGSIVPGDGFWIDAIKSRCYVKYSTVEEAKETRHALHGVTWPASNPKQLAVDFSTEVSMKGAMEGGRQLAATQKEPDRRTLLEERREREREREVRERDKVHDREVVRDRKHGEEGKTEDKERERKVRVVEREREEKSGRTVRKVTIPVREWDLGKAERGFSPPPPDRADIRRYGEPEQEERRKRDKDRGRRSSSLEPVRKVKRKEDAPPTKLLLDDLFRKTKAMPSIYWLPLTSQQIAVREEMRRKHMEEHEKQLAEERKRREAKRRRPRSKSRSRSPKK